MLKYECINTFQEEKMRIKINRVFPDYYVVYQLSTVYI